MKRSAAIAIGLLGAATMAACTTTSQRSVGSGPSNTTGATTATRTASNTPPAPTNSTSGGGEVASNCPATGSPTVSDANALTQALGHASAGQVIVLAPGNYKGQFTASGDGTAAAPITLCGPRSAVLEGASVKKGYVLHLSAAHWWRVFGFTVQNGQKGVMADQSGHNVIGGLAVHTIGDEAIHLRNFSSDNVVEGNVVSDTGRRRTKFGEGIYVGTAHSNWCTYSNCKVDNSDRNIIRDNTVSNTTAENIDIKEGTSNGVIQGNHLSGVGMDSSAATAWVNVKGNNWTVADNVGADSNKDGFQVHQVWPGWGENNVFRGNQANVNASGWGYYVQSESLHAVIACTNAATGAGSGTTNQPCSK